MKRTPLQARHLSLGARMVEFAGWQMPLQYPGGIFEEHLLTRKTSGLFDVSHMGRFLISGKGCLPFLQHVLSNNAAALHAGRAQYTLIPNVSGGAIDDAYLYRLEEQRFLLVVNAANRDADLQWFRSLLPKFPGVQLSDLTDELAMLSLQGPESQKLLSDVLGSEGLPRPGRNNLSTAAWRGKDLIVARTGYAGEPLGFELFVPASGAEALWDSLLEAGAAPVGLGARDTLRLEAGLPLYGQELGTDRQGREIPVFACPPARFAVSFSPLKGRFVGREPLAEQLAAWKRITAQDISDYEALPHLIRLFTVLDRGIARPEAELYRGQRKIGRVTSGTMLPYWLFTGKGRDGEFGEGSGRRAVGMAKVDSAVEEGTEVQIEVRGRRLRALLVPRLLESGYPPFARPVLWE